MRCRKHWTVKCVGVNESEFYGVIHSGRLVAIKELGRTLLKIEISGGLPL